MVESSNWVKKNTMPRSPSITILTRWLFTLADAKTAEPVAAPEITVTPAGKDALTLKAVPQKGDPEGKASKFELVSKDVVHELMETGSVHGELRITIGDKSYTGPIDYHLDDHEHDEKKK